MRFKPVTTLEECAALDTDEIVSGYAAGRQGRNAPDDCSESWWHGWRNGLVDGKHMQKDEAQVALARAYIQTTSGRGRLQ